MQIHFNYVGKGKVAKDIVATPFEWRGENALHQVFNIYGSMDNRDGREEGMIRFSRSVESRSRAPRKSDEHVDGQDEEFFRKLR